jgi:hypothetical protein
MGMILKLTKQLVNALHENGPEGLEVVDPDTNRVYMLVDGDTYRQAMAALHRQKNRNAIAAGLSEMETGKGKPADQVFEEIRERLNFPQQS